MATAWDVAGLSSGITVLGWLLAPIISLLLPKILSGLGFDASQKLRELEIHVIPDLRRALQEVDEQRMLREARKETSNMITLGKLAGMLRHALYEAEDILDLVEYHWIERKVVGDGSWRQRLCDTVATCNMSCWSGYVHIIGSGSAQLLKWARDSSLCRFLRRSDDVLPVSAMASAVLSDGPVLVTTSAAPSNEPVHVARAVPTEFFGRWLSSLCSSFNFFNNCVRSILYWLDDVIEVANTYRNWSYDVVGITSHQENATAVDSVFSANSRRNLKKRIEKVESTVKEVKQSHLLDVASKSTSNDTVDMNRRKIRSSSSKREVFGREVLLDDIMAKMLHETPHNDAPSSSRRTCYSVIGIYGVAGSGKTTLARYILDHVKEYKDAHFDTLMCVHISESFSVDDILHDMLEDISKDRHSIISGCEEMKRELKKKLGGKRFFLILDDLWVKDKNYQGLKELLSPLNVGMKGSKILVTARREDAVRAMGADEPIAISDLDEEQYFRMFMHYALDGTCIHYEEFIPVGRKIAKKLHRSPIAAVTVAGQLRGNPNISFWKTTAELDVLNGTMGALWWNYMQLDVDIRRCFEYCNIIPRRFKLKRDELVRLWVAQGFVKTSCATEATEDVAEIYVQELVSCSFLQPAGTSPDTDYFTIHDLLHDLADKVTGNDCYRIENAGSWKGDVPQDVRHLFVHYYDGELITEKILELENLHTLIIYVVGKDTPVEKDITESIFNRLRKLRVLAIALSQDHDALFQEPRMFSVPESIRQLKHLRYLALRTISSCTVILPNAPIKLYHLQVLDFGQCQKVEFFSADLLNLRHVLSDLKLCNIGRLISLQTIPYFTVRNKQGYEVKQLRDLNKLRGTLRINCLENVKSKQEALEANLAAKEQLTFLSLFWTVGDTRCRPEVEAEVLEGLCPPMWLEKLAICYYNGSRYPNWMVSRHNGGPKDLQVLTFWGLKQLGPAPELDAFIHLNSLNLLDCSWDALPVNIEHLSSLKELKILVCLNIRVLPTLPQSLEEFYLVGCNDEFMKSCQTVGHPNWQKIKHVRTKDIICMSKA